jgi:hypothetical protein
MKNTTNMGSVPQVFKKYILILQLKQSRKWYNFGPSKLFQFYFNTKGLFCFIFWSLVERGENERSLDSGGREKAVVGTDLGHQNRGYWCQIVPFDEGSSY